MTAERSLATISRDRPVLIAGPTASGKSALAMALAARDGRLIVNADALQVYGCWRILTARPSAADEAALPHALYGHVGRAEPWSVGHWLRAVAPLLDRPVVIVGGTGLYLSALTEGLAEIPAVRPAIRAEAEARLAEGGTAALIADLDPATAARIDLMNPVRVQRAWEVLQATGRGLADWQADTGAPLLPATQAETLLVMPDRDVLAARILARLQAMAAQGAFEEVAAELPHWDPARPSGKAIGVAEFAACLRGETTAEAAITAAATATRQYAKRQRSWFRGRMRDWRIVAT